VNHNWGDDRAETDRLEIRDDSAGLPPDTAETAELVEPEVDQYDEVLHEFEQLQNPQAGWAKAIQTLVFTGILFALLGMFRNPAADIGMLMVVILVHELGHFLGMRLFGYSNIRMFFIPLFGAGVSGRKIGVDGYKEGIVVLLGPLPGLVISFVLAVAYGVTAEPWLGRAALWFAILNGFNLLPVFPLDGGRLLQITLFSRNPYFESLFEIVAALALLALAFFGGMWVLYILAGLMLLGLSVKFKSSSLARELNRELAELQLPPSNDIPRPLFRHMVDRVRERFPTATGPREVARFVLHVWERMHSKPPGVLATLALLFVYGSTLLATLVVPVVLMIVFGWVKQPAG
jgi:Zn-dependent protease